MVRGGRWWWVVAVVSVALLAAGLAWFLADQHLDKADKWASVIGMFVGIAGLLASAYSLVQTHRSAQTGTPGGSVTNTIRGGQVHGPVLMGRDLRRVSLTGTLVPAPGPDVAPETSAGPEAGDVNNRVENATMAGPLLMGRDMSDVVLPLPTPPAATPEGGDGTSR